MKTEREIIHGLVEALRWCSGSDDFQKGRQAEQGWAKVAGGVLPEADAYLALCRSQQPQYESRELGEKIEKSLDALARICPGRRELLLQVLMHVTVGALEGRDEAFVSSYFMKIGQMLDGHFDR